MKPRYIFAVFTLTFLCVANGFGQRDRAFVSLSGSDTANCGAQITPCKTFSGGLYSIASGGSVIALDSGIYDTINVTITKSATLMAAPGVHVEFFNNYINPDRITINAGSSSRVTLRNLYISNLSGQYAGQGNGIKVTSVGVLQIENCVIDGFATGLSVSLANSAQISLTSSVIRNNDEIGAYFTTSSGKVKVAIDGCHFDENRSSSGSDGYGVFVADNAKVTVRNSVASGNGLDGFVSYNNGSSLNLDHCEASNNLNGVDASSEGNVTISNSTVTQNSQYGLLQIGTGIIQSLGNNVVRHNGTNSYGTISIISGT